MYLMQCWHFSRLQLERDGLRKSQLKCSYPWFSSCQHSSDDIGGDHYFGDDANDGSDIGDAADDDNIGSSDGDFDVDDCGDDVGDYDLFDVGNFVVVLPMMLVVLMVIMI